MSNLRSALIGLCVAGASLGVMAQTTDEHKDHHPAGSAAGAAPPATTPKQARTTPPCPPGKWLAWPGWTST